MRHMAQVQSITFQCGYVVGGSIVCAHCNKILTASYSAIQRKAKAYSYARLLVICLLKYNINELLLVGEEIHA